MKRLARLFFLTVVIAGLCPAIMGCVLFESPNKAFVTGVDAGLNSSGLLDEYDKYIDADPKLKDDSKKIRHETATKLRKLVEDAKK